MPEESRIISTVRFGPFELSTDTGELRKNGIRIKLFGQPIKVLTLLLATPGQVVTREQLQKSLWPGDTFGDFERGLNAAVNRLRENLGDSASEPTYVETLPGRGYRFIGKIESDGSKLTRLEADPSKVQVVKSQKYTLIAFIQRESAVGWAAELVVWVRHELSEENGAPRATKAESPPLGGCFFERAFELEVILDESGIPQSSNIILRLDAPDFKCDQSKKELSVPPDADSQPCTFLIKPCLPGDLVANLELLTKDQKIIASRSIRTRALRVGDDDFRSGFSISFGPLKEQYEDLRREVLNIPALEQLPPEQETHVLEASAAPSTTPIARLVAETGSVQGRSFTLTDGMTNISIGRSRECEICLVDPQVARFHCRLRIEPDHHDKGVRVRYVFTLIDSGSRAGLQVNGISVDRAELQHGDRFQVGPIRFRFAVVDDALVHNADLDEGPRAQSGPSPYTKQQTRVLEAAAPKEATVGCSIEVIAMVRESDSEGGLRALLFLEKVSGPNKDDVRERPFELQFPLDTNGKPLPLGISLRLESPGFEPASQIKKLRVPPAGNSPACTFVVSPRLVGEHVMNLELLDPQEQILVSRSIRTRALASGVESSRDRILVTIPLLVVIQGSEARVGRSGSEPDEMSLDETSLLDQVLEGRTLGQASEPVLSNTEGMTKDIRSVTYDFLEQFQPIARPDQNANCRLTGLPEEGLVISHYRLIKVTAHTGTLVVCEAEDLKTGRLVAIKLRPTHVRLGEASEPNQECFLDDIEELRPSELNERDRAKAAGGFEHVVYRSEGHASRRRRWWLIASSVLVLGFLALFFGFDIAFYRAGTRSKPIDRVKDTGAIVLATPSNSTGDPAFDNLDLASDNSVHAHDSVRLPETNVLSKDQVSEILKKMNRSPDERLTPDRAEEICLRANARAVVTGSIAADGTQYKITIEALGCRTGQTLQAVEGRATDRAAVPELARVLTAQILDKLAK